MFQQKAKLSYLYTPTDFILIHQATVQEPSQQPIRNTRSLRNTNKLALGQHERNVELLYSSSIFQHWDRKENKPKKVAVSKPELLVPINRFSAEV